jgi:hypothetical protein
MCKETGIVLYGMVWYGMVFELHRMAD